MSDKEIFIHSSSFVDEGAVIGPGTHIWHFCHIFPGARIGQNCKIGQNVVVHSTAVIGNRVKIQNNVSIYDGVTLDDEVFCGPSCVFTNIINPRAAIPRNSADHYRMTRVKKGATIGANATIVCGLTIGQHAFVGAGSVVTHDVPDHALVYGCPARQNGWMCECGNKLHFDNGHAVCSECDRQYKEHNPQMISKI